MKKIYLMLASALIGAGSVMAQTTWQTQKLGEVKVDTLYHATVGPGTTQTQIHITYTRNGNPAESKITYTTSDLTNEYVTIKAGVARGVAYGKPQTVKGMMDDRTSYQKHYFVGINGDFAGLESNQSIPCGALIEDGAFVTGAGTLTGNILSNYLIIGKDGLPTIASTIEYNHNKAGTVTYPSGAVETELTANNGRWDECIIAYNKFWGYQAEKGGSTQTNQWGNEAELLPVETNTVYGNEAEFIVNRTATAGNMKIPHPGLVLSGVGSKRTDGKLDALKAGDIVKIKFPFKADGVETSARELLGGWGVTVKEGVVQNLPSKVPSDIAAKIPRARTAVGYNADKSKFVMAVVQEENSKGLNGMTIVEFGDILASIGCTEALNLDGGGSTVMFVENLGQRSSVQGGALGGFTRSVANGLFAVTNAPEDREVARIEFVDKALTIQPGRGYQPVIYAYNKYGVLISTGLQNYTLSAPEATFDASNRKMIAPAEGYFALTATYNGITTSIPVKVDAAGIAGSDPAAAPSFSGNEFTAIPEKPADWVDPNQPNLYIAGKVVNDWDFFNPLVVRPYPGKNNVYEFDIDSFESPAIDGTYFKMTTMDPRTNGGSAAFKAEGCAWHTNEAGAEKPNILGNSKTLTLLPGNADNISTPWTGKWHFSVDLNEKTITATTETPRPAIDEPEHVYLTGNIDGDTEGRIEMTGINGLYKAVNVNITDAAMFAFIADGTGYGPYIDGIGIETEDDFYAGGNSWQIEPGAYDITFSINTFKVTIAPHIFAMLEDVTPAGYDFDKYEAGTMWKFATLPATTTSGTWTAPAGIYKQENMDADGHVTALHLAGVDLDKQDEKGILTDRTNAFSVQKHPSELVGNCLVFAQNYSPGHYRCGWPNTKINQSQGMQLSFYADPSKINGADAEHPVRFRMVFQILYRGRHGQPGVDEIPNVYASASNASNAWATSYNGVTDNEVGAQFPVHHSQFYKWENEGTTVAEIPEEKVLVDGGEGANEPWDVDPNTKEPLEQGGYSTRYLINSERFVVYEYDFYGKPENGTLGVHVNFGGGSYATYVFKEIKFFNVLNGDELLGKSGKTKAPARVANIEKPFITNTAAGSLLGTRSISYRYYTEEGVKEFKAEETNTGIDNVVADGDSNAPVEYYNLQGIRVDNPANGIYIKRQGSKATKVLIR